MQSTKTYKTHAALVDNMAEAQGLDLEELMLRGKLTTFELENAVLTCTGCSQPSACAQWLDTPSERLEDRPAYCRNGDLFDLLKQA